MWVVSLWQNPDFIPSSGLVTAYGVISRWVFFTMFVRACLFCTETPATGHHFAYSYAGLTKSVWTIGQSDTPTGWHCCERGRGSCGRI